MIFCLFIKMLHPLQKTQGSQVKTGEVIAETGFVSPLQNKESFQFELWNNGTPVDPTQYINFQ